MKKVPFVPVIIATGFGAGFSPWAPGTAGALLATGLWFVAAACLSAMSLFWFTVSFILLFTLLGIWATNQVEPFWGEDPSKVVVDEMVGVWISLLAVPAGHWGYGIAAFLLFRLFDIWKPLGIRRMESFPGGIGVMMDDILAGLYGGLALVGWQWLVA